MKPGVAGYLEWQSAVIADPGLAADAKASGRKGGLDIRVVAFAITASGRFGRGCFASSATLARTLHVDRKVIERARQELTARGWLAVVSRKGGRTGRALVVDICLPSANRQDAPREAPAVPCWKCGSDTERSMSPTGQIGYVCRADPYRETVDPMGYRGFAGHFPTGLDGKRYADAA